MSTEWMQPAGYKLSSIQELKELTDETNVVRVVDTLPAIVDDIFELEHPDMQQDVAARVAFKDEMLKNGPAYGTWFHFPWDNSLVRFPPSDDHFDLRTFRNRNLITFDEQRLLRSKKVAAFGLSVGRSVVEGAVQSGIGQNYLLFDKDTISITNLNRIDASMDEVGLEKTTSIGRKISKLDPYVAQQHFPNGYDETTDDILRDSKPDIIIEEVDDLQVKVRLRDIAQELRVPLVMTGDVDDTSVMHVERYDIDEDTQPFNGTLPLEAIQALRSNTLPPQERIGVLAAMLGGMQNVSPRLLQSVGVINKELAGMPQLRTTAGIGGGMTAVAIREILLGNTLNSGIRVQNSLKIVQGFQE